MQGIYNQCFHWVVFKKQLRAKIIKTCVNDVSEKKQRKGSLKARIGAYRLKSQIVLCSSNNVIQFIVRIEIRQKLFEQIYFTLPFKMYKYNMWNIA